MMKDYKSKDWMKPERSWLVTIAQALGMVTAGAFLIEGFFHILGM